MNYILREMQPSEFPLLEDFLYEAIFQRDETCRLPRNIIEKPELQIYIKDFGQGKDDHCICAEINDKIVGAVWVRTIPGYGSIDNETPEFSISLYKSHRGFGIGTALMKNMLEYLKNAGYPRGSLSVQKENNAYQLYLSLGFQVLSETEEEAIMVYDFNQSQE